MAQLYWPMGLFAGIASGTGKMKMRLPWMSLSDNPNMSCHCGGCEDRRNSRADGKLINKTRRRNRRDRGTERQTERQTKKQTNKAKDTKQRDSIGPQKNSKKGPEMLQ